jgi:hypothetical protein
MVPYKHLGRFVASSLHARRRFVTLPIVDSGSYHEIVTAPSALQGFRKLSWSDCTMEALSLSSPHSILAVFSLMP